METEHYDQRWDILSNLIKDIPYDFIKKSYNGYCIGFTDSSNFLKLRIAGNKAIDICSVDKSLIEVQKSDAIIYLVKSKCYQNVLFFGNETQIGGRDSAIARNKTLLEVKVLSVEDHRKFRTENGVINLSELGLYNKCKTNSERTLLSLEALISYCNESIDVSSKKHQYYACKKYLNSLGFEVKLDKEEEFWICFDVDDTILGHCLDDSSRRETLSDERKDIRNAIFELWVKGFNIAFISDNSYETIMGRVIAPLLTLVKSTRRNNSLWPLNLVCNGMATALIITPDGKQIVDMQYSSRYLINSHIIDLLIHRLGKIKLNSDGIVTESIGILGEYYNSLMIKRGCNNTELLAPPNIEIRKIPFSDLVNQISIKPIISI